MQASGTQTSSGAGAGAGPAGGGATGGGGGSSCNGSPGCVWKVPCACGQMHVPKALNLGAAGVGGGGGLVVLPVGGAVGGDGGDP
jgi:hypothetical protein